jgi:ABC-2 type transport system permease protein
MSAIDLRPAARPSGTTGVGAALVDVSAMIGREVRRTVRSIDSLVTSFALPVGIMLVFVVVFGGAIERDGDYISYAVPGTLILCLGFNSASVAVAVAQDMRTGTIDRIKTMPVFGPALLWGHVVASVLRNLSASVPVVGVALLLGYRPAADAAGWVAAVAFGTLIVLAFTWFACVFGLLLSVDAASGVNFVFLFLPYVSSAFVPIDTLPVWLRGFASAQPYTPVTETLRSLLAGQGPGAELVPALAWLVGILVVSCAVASWLFRARTAR